MINSKKIILILAFFLLLTAGFFLKVRFLNPPTLITITGEGKVKVAPTMVKFTITTLNSGESATQVIADNNNIIKNLVSILKNFGVLENDISLSYVRVVPPQTTLGQTSSQAVNTIDATLKNLAKFDNLVLSLYQGGAQSVSNILFTTENSKDLEKQAVNLSIIEAKKKS